MGTVRALLDATSFGLERLLMKLILASAAMTAGLLLVGQGPALAANTDPAAVHAGSYHVEPSHTRVQFTVNHFGFTDYWGDVTGVSGALSIDPKAPAASKISVSIPVDSVSTTNARLDGEIKSDMFLDGTKYPTITFTSTSVTPTGPGTATVVGDLTLHGVTHPVTLNAKFNGAGLNPMSMSTTVGFNAEGHFNRSDFGVTKYVPMVSDQVDIRISAAFEKDK
jgi:polyisoprenoid-binding protein YceI